MELAEKIKLLRASGVKKFKDATIEIEFEIPPLSAEPEKLPPNMPAELQNPDLMSHDTVLNWSAAPEAIGEGEALPMTGDQPLEPGAAPTQ